MTTSGSTDFDVTTMQIIKDALLLNGVVDPFNDVDENDRDICLRFLNMIMKNAQKDSDLWVTTDITHTLTAGTQSYTVGSSIDPDGIAESQTISGATTVTLNGALVSGGTYTGTPARKIGINSAGDDSGITFTIVGTDSDNTALTEVVTGSGDIPGIAYSTGHFKSVTSITTSGSTASTIEVGPYFDIDTPRPLRLKTCRRQDSSGNEITVDVESRQDYMEQPTKSTQSPVLMAYYDPQRDNGVLYVWPTGSSGNLTLIMTFQRPIEDFDENGNNPDLPDEWNIWLVYQLATLISPIYTGQLRQDLLTIAVSMLDSLKKFDTEQVPINFQPTVDR